MIGILGGRDFLKGCSDLLFALTPHLLIVFTIAGLEKRRAKRMAKLRASDLLPNDILLDLLASLPVKSLCCMRAVSKTYLNIIDDPAFATMYASRLLNSAMTPIPQLMLVTKTTYRPKRYEYIDVNTLQSLKYNGKQSLVKSRPCNITKIVSRKGYEVRFVFCNLFLFEKSGGLFLVNPLRGEALKLPIIYDIVPGKRHLRDGWFGMGFDDVTSTHKIVCLREILVYSEFTVVANVYTLGGTTWREINSVPQCELSIKQSVSAYGDMHWLIYEHQHHIISFDFNKEEFVFTPHPKLEEYIGCSMQLLHYRGCLALVSRSISHLEIWVLRDYETKEWELECKIATGMFDRIRLFDPLYGTCSEWEHGILFTSNDVSKRMFPFAFHFWDARYKSLEYIDPQTLLPSVFSRDHQLWSGQNLVQPQLSIFSYTDESLISLKRYGNLVERKVFRSAVFEAAQTSTISLD